MGKNKGLIIALILLVIVAIALGITTYFFKKKADELQAQKLALDADNTRQKAELQVRDDEIVVLKQLIGYAGASLDEIRQSFDTQMKLSAPGVEKPTYVSVIQNFQSQLIDLSKQVRESKEAVTRVEAELAKVKEDTQKKIAIADEKAKKAEAERAGLDEKFSETNKERDASIADARTKMDSSVKKSSESARNQEAEVERALGVVRDKQEQIEILQQIVRESSLPPQDNPMGQIIYVYPDGNQGVINLGRADQLKRGITFSVYEPTDMSVNGQKGTIEVINVFDDRKADVRIFNKDESDPVRVDDVIYTPTWAPGFQERFALVGVLDIDGDGASDLSTILALIRKNGGLVDAYMTDEGLQEGKITARTTWVVRGEAPKPPQSNDDKRGNAALATFSNMTGEVSKFNTKEVQLSEFLRKMGYQPPVRVRSASIMPESGSSRRVSTGSVSGAHSSDSGSRTPRRTPPRSAY